MIESDKAAIEIYVAMARDVGDALDMIASCSDRDTLETLARILEAPGGPGTDRDLNEVMLGPVRRRLAFLQEAA